MGAWSNREWVGAAAGVALLLLTGYLTYQRNENELSSYLIGTVIGAMVVAFVVGALVRWLWIEVGDGLPPVTDTPAWLAVAGVVGVVFAVGMNVTGDDGEALACAKPEAGHVGGGYTLTAAPDAADQQIQAALAAAPEGDRIEGVHQFVVTGGSGNGVSVLVSMPIKGGIAERDRDDFMRGASGGLSLRGVSPQNHDVAGLTAVGGQMPQGYLMLTADGCGALQAAAPSAGEAKAILENVIRD